MKPDPRRVAARPFEAGAFHPQFPAGHASGLLYLDSGCLRFESEKGSFALPVAGLKLEVGGTDRLIFFSHPAQPDVAVHTADRAVLEHPVIAAMPELDAQRAKIHGRNRRTALVLWSVAALFVAVVAGLFLSRDWLIKTAAAAVPVEWEVQAGDGLFEQVARSKIEIKDPALAQELQAITSPLVAGIADLRYPLTFHIVDEPTLNAFAIPGGHVVVHSGLLLAAEQPEEVAGVLAHEIAHVTHRHGIRNIISSAGLYFAISALVGDASGLIAILADNSAYLLGQKFSRDFEREADAAGWDYLLQSDIDPRGMITFFERLQREENQARGTLPTGGLDFLGTHPATAERIALLQARWENTRKQTGYRKIPVNYGAFKAGLRDQLHPAGPANPAPGRTR